MAWRALLSLSNLWRLRFEPEGRLLDGMPKANIDHSTVMANQVKAWRAMRIFLHDNMGYSIGGLLRPFRMELEKAHEKR